MYETNFDGLFVIPIGMFLVAAKNVDFQGLFSLPKGARSLIGHEIYTFLLDNTSLMRVSKSSSRTIKILSSSRILISPI